MARTLKKSRIKGLPPKVQLRTQDALTGSVPAHVRVTSDNRSGNFTVRYDDSNTIEFETYPVLELPSGLPTGHPATKRTNSSGALVDNDEMLTDIVVSAPLRKGVGDTWGINVPGQTITPFRDSGHPAVDAKSVRSGSSQDPFYATGSHVYDIGEGFSQPLWDKTKIEIDLTPSAVHSCSIVQSGSAATGINYPMCYWNNDTRKFEGIGGGQPFRNYETPDLDTLKQNLEEQCIGFNESLFEALGAPNPQLNESRGQPVSTWGFPYHPKFHATSSNCIYLSGVLNGPFLLEKVVLEFSGTYTARTGNWDTSIHSYNVSITNFFILNQREPFSANIPDQQTLDYSVAGVRDQFVTGASIPGNTNNYSARDLVTTLKIAAFISSDGTVANMLPTVRDAYDQVQADLKLVSGSTGLGTNGGPATWKGRYIVSGTVRSAIANPGMGSILTTGATDAVFVLNKLQFSNRSGLFGASGRSWISDFSSGERIRETTQDGWTYSVLRNYSKNNPYVLLPTDRLILGWQIPLSRIMNEDTLGASQFVREGGYLQFAAAPAKLTLYGSLIREGKEHHDTLNQLLTSPGVHEVIE